MLLGAWDSGTQQQGHAEGETETFERRGSLPTSEQWISISGNINDRISIKARNKSNGSCSFQQWSCMQSFLPRFLRRRAIAICFTPVSSDIQKRRYRVGECFPRCKQDSASMVETPAKQAADLRWDSINLGPYARQKIWNDSLKARQIHLRIDRRFLILIF